MSSFQGAHDFNIENLIQAQTYTTVTVGSSTSPLEVLRGHIEPGALHNSRERAEAPNKCHPDTRVAVQEEILRWVAEPIRPTEQILWVTGPAGAGKTAIAGSIADTCYERGDLAASFFFSSFSGEVNRCRKRCLVSTLAYQLRQHPALQGISREMLASIENDPAIFEKCLLDQLKLLILNPLGSFCDRGVGPSQPDAVWRPIIIIDGLDECGPDEEGDPSKVRSGLPPRTKENEHEEILSILKYALDSSAFPFRIILFSRPERAIRQFFSTELESGGFFSKIFLDEKYNPSLDIARYLRFKFASIRDRYRLPDNWPTEEQMEALLEAASGQFIYAATIIRYVEDTRNPPVIQLNHLLEVHSPSSTPLESLDALYTQIIDTSPNPFASLCWLWAIQKLIIWPHSPLALPALFCNQFLASIPGEAEYLLGNLTSLIDIPPIGDATSPYKFYHRTLLDFIGQPSRHAKVAGAVEAKNGLELQYSSGINLFITQYIKVLMNKGPCIPLEKGIELFLDYFGTLPVYSFASLYIARFSRTPAWVHDSLSSCDVPWWMNRITTTYNAMLGYHQFELLSIVHFGCPWYRCSAACRYWKKSILNCRTLVPIEYYSSENPQKRVPFWHTRSQLSTSWFWKNVHLLVPVDSLAVSDLDEGETSERMGERMEDT
ncbi:hypothetical protein DFP72DRAFT_1005752 [Ephemerocybe angulata]|uniref:Nephrocystin 3-like N-terminal domain-containing protein n=1 Tax=Ephemerocybe angulata TaxID=980116 RepID=A0A8H6I684_9AGAR|nr:hypothetical protein DFP72DRAFT_1005752 [Tulosesus angulatus]